MSVKIFPPNMDSKHPIVFERQVFQDADLVFCTSDETIDVLTRQSKHSGHQGGGSGVIHTE